MATYGHTFTSGDTLTPTKLNAARTATDIVNADIKSDAAIAGTKIAPDFGSQNVTTSGGIAAGAASRAVGGNTAQLQSHGTTGSRLAATRWTADTNGPILTLAKSRGAAVGTRGVVQSGDNITSMEFYGDDGTNDVLAARILAQVDGTPGTNDMPGRLVFSTTADGASTVTERMRITSSGNVGIGTSSPLSTNGGLDIASGGLGLVIGAESGSSARTNATTKLGRIVVPHYTNAEEPLAGLIASSESSASFIGIGGGSSSANAATAITFYTASNNTTTTGTARATINSSGNVGIGTSSPTAPLTVATGTVAFTGVAGADGTVSIGNAADTGINVPAIVGHNTTGLGLRVIARTADGNTAGDLNFDARLAAGGSFTTLNQPAFRFTHNGSHLASILRSGNVGIGKTNPATILDVNGTVTATAFAGPLTGDVTGTASAIADGSVSAAAKIADGVVTAAKLSGAQTGAAPIFGVRAWGKFAGQASNGACVVNASGNVTSVSRDSNGVYEVVMATALEDANYAVVTSSTSVHSYVETFTETTTTFRLEFRDGANDLANPAEASFMVIR